jgi:hypothetical protein
MTAALQRAAPAHFVADLDKMHAYFAACGAITRDSDGWQGIDTSKAPADAVESYGRLLSTGYAKGWL